jgi:hypothetical protein
MPKKRKVSRKPRLTRVSVRAERRDEVDWDRFAWALLQYSRLLLAQEEAKQGNSPSPEGQPKP